MRAERLATLPIVLSIALSIGVCAVLLGSAPVAAQPYRMSDEALEPAVARAVQWFADLTDFGGDQSSLVVVDALAHRFEIYPLRNYVQRIADEVDPADSVAPFLRLVGVGYAPPLTSDPFGIDTLRAISCVSRGPAYEPPEPDGERYLLTHRALAIALASDLGCGAPQRMAELRSMAQRRLAELTEAHAITTPLGLEAWAMRLLFDRAVLPDETRRALIATQHADGSWGNDRNRVHETAVALWVLLESSGRAPAAAFAARAH